jgi:hypothetical protein
MAGGVSAHQADKKHPNMAETTTNPQKSEQNGIARGAIAPTPSVMNVTTRALTLGRVVSIPDNILQVVLQIPTIEMRKAALTSEIPFPWARLGRKI